MTFGVPVPDMPGLVARIRSLLKEAERAFEHPLRFDAFQRIGAIATNLEERERQRARRKDPGV